MSDKPSRIHFLDGLRGLAILLVVGFHYVEVGHVDKLPYGARLAWIPLFNHGWVGVYLFFLVSGYVIFMTLEKCATLGEFLQRRWLRLFPAMFVVSVAIYILSQVAGDKMPEGRVTAIDLLPGLTFISDTLWHAGLHRDIRSMDGVFWTLYVEVGFYFVVGALHFLLGWKRTLLSFIAIWVFSVIVSEIAGHLSKTPLFRAVEPLQWMGVPLYGWFAAGALFYKAHELGSNRLFYLAILIGIASVFSYSSKPPLSTTDRTYLLGCVLIFTAAQRLKILQNILQCRIALFVGLISYPLYLLHNQIGIGLMGVVGPHLPVAVLPFLPVAMTMFVSMLAWVIAVHLEPHGRSMLKQGLTALHLAKAQTA